MSSSKLAAILAFLTANPSRTLPGFRLASPTIAQTLPAKSYRHGLTRRQLRAARALSGLKKPGDCATFWERQRKLAHSRLGK